jgi:predicted deacylase
MQRSLIASISTLLLIGVAFAQDRASFSVGTATAKRGEKVTGVIAVPAGVDAATNIPVAVVHGAKPGPVLALVAGSHGTEYASIIALEKMIAMLNPAEISGTVIIVPLVNIPSFEQKIVHVNPVDGKSMNHMYPGKIDGTQTDRASCLITKQVVEQCDHLIDLHGGDLDEVCGNTATGQRPVTKPRIASRERCLALGSITSSFQPNGQKSKRLTVPREHRDYSGQAFDHRRSGPRRNRRARRRLGVDRRQLERYALSEDAVRRAITRRASGVGRKDRHYRQ